MRGVLRDIGRILNQKDICWAVGASLLLNHHGLVDKPSDIDILISKNDIDRGEKYLDELGNKNKDRDKGLYETERFCEYVINSIDVDVMSGLKIKHADGVYEFEFDSKSIVDSYLIDGVSIPIMAMEDWYVIYSLIPNRELKVDMIYNYFKTNGIKRGDLLERTLTKNIPRELRENIVELLTVYK